jgi:membrane protease subunit HflC
MKKTILKVVLLVLAGVALVLSFEMFFIVRQDQQAVVLRLGKIVRTTTEAGLHFKIPFMDAARIFTKRLIEYDADPVAVVTSDKKSIIFDTIAIFRIKDLDTFYRRIKTVAAAQQRLDDSVYSAVRVVAGYMTFDDLLSDKRLQVIKDAETAARREAEKYGLELDQVAFKRVFLPKENEESVYQSMQAERNRIAAQLRAEGRAEAMAIRSRAERQRTEILSNARKTAQETMGKGDKEAQDIIENATRNSKELFLFLKTMEFYKTNLKNLPIIVGPEGVLRYLINPMGSGVAPGAN